MILNWSLWIYTGENREREWKLLLFFLTAALNRFYPHIFFWFFKKEGNPIFEMFFIMCRDFLFVFLCILGVGKRGWGWGWWFIFSTGGRGVSAQRQKKQASDVYLPSITREKFWVTKTQPKEISQVTFRLEGAVLVRKKKRSLT